MAMVNAKSTKKLIEMLMKILKREPTLKELHAAMHGSLPKAKDLKIGGTD